MKYQNNEINKDLAPAFCASSCSQSVFNGKTYEDLIIFVEKVTSERFECAKKHDCILNFMGLKTEVVKGEINE